MRYLLTRTHQSQRLEFVRAHVKTRRRIISLFQLQINLRPKLRRQHIVHKFALFIFLKWDCSGEPEQFVTVLNYLQCNVCLFIAALILHFLMSFKIIHTENNGRKKRIVFEFLKCHFAEVFAVQSLFSFILPHKSMHF